MTEIEEFILQYEAEQKKILQNLHSIMSSYPGITGKIRYDIPFYYRKSWICYLNPLKNRSVEFAFTRGHELSNVQGILDARGRKQVSSIIFASVKEIPERTIHEIIHEALILDEEVPYAPKRTKH